MKNTTIILIILLLFSGCASDNNNKINIQEDKQTINSEDFSSELDSIAHLEKLRFFGYEKETTIDSLRVVISNAKTVKAYCWNSKDKNPANVYHYIVDANGVFDDRIEFEITLNDTQVNEFIGIVCDSKIYSDTTELGTSCFIPHIAFVYFNENDSIIGQSNYCYMFYGGIKNVPKTESKRLTKAGNIRMIEFCKTIGLDIP